MPQIRLVTHTLLSAQTNGLEKVFIYAKVRFHSTNTYNLAYNILKISRSGLNLLIFYWKLLKSMSQIRLVAHSPSGAARMQGLWKSSPFVTFQRYIIIKSLSLFKIIQKMENLKNLNSGKLQPIIAKGHTFLYRHLRVRWGGPLTLIKNFYFRFLDRFLPELTEKVPLVCRIAYISQIVRYV